MFPIKSVTNQGLKYISLISFCVFCLFILEQKFDSVAIQDIITDKYLKWSNLTFLGQNLLQNIFSCYLRGELC